MPAVLACAKCGATGCGNWSQCDLLCIQSFSPFYSPEEARKYAESMVTVEQDEPAEQEECQ